MITGIHAMFFTPAADELRAFLRDKLHLSHTDTGGGWLIFHPPAAEIGCHPSQRRFQGLSFYCEDLPETMAALRRRGVEFTADIGEQEWGWVTRFRIPGGDEVELYQPKYSTRRGRRRGTRPATRRRRARAK
jgi:hypothetical protein